MVGGDLLVLNHLAAIVSLATHSPPGSDGVTTTSENAIAVIYPRMLQHRFVTQEFQCGTLLLDGVERNTGVSHHAYQLQFDS